MNFVDLLALTDGDGIGYLFPAVKLDDEHTIKTWVLAVKAQGSLNKTF